MVKYDFIVIGAGIVGLATALKILEKNPKAKLLILEKENEVARHQTGNNSGVIHSGIYYKPGSLKAKNCISGYKQLLQFCDEENIDYKICGKVIVAVSEKEIPILNNIYERGILNGLKNLRKISSEEIKEVEPHADGLAGIFVSQTGIIDFTAVARKYLEVIHRKGGEVKFNQKVKSIKKSNGQIEIKTLGETYLSNYLISCAGLYSDKIAKLTHSHLPIRIIPFRGEYYKLKDERKSLVKALIYPVPNPAFPFLGVHFTRMMDGSVEAGPNAVLSFKREGYSKFDFNFNDTLDTFLWPGFWAIAKKYWRIGFGEFYRSYNKQAFVKALQKLIPEIQKSDLITGGAGVRAQACDKEGGLIDDFYIVEDKNIIHVCNAPSPAATASLAIGDHIASIIFK